MAGVDYVHHEAALVPVTKAGQRFFAVNETGTQIALDAAADSKVKRFIYMSSCAIFAGALDRCPLGEDTQPKSLEIYGASKLAGERYVTKKMRDGFPCAVIRPQCIIGAERLGVFQILFDWIRDNKNIYVIGNGNNPFQFIHVRDLAEVSILCAEQDKTGIYHVGTDRFSTIREDLAALMQHAGASSKIISLPVFLTIPLLRALDILHLSPLGPFHYRIYHKPRFVKHYEWLQAQEGRSTHRSPVKQGILKIVKWLS
jgi:nucleoside-diphosphate-sugar epimerase